MPSPSLVFSFIIATLYGSSFHMIAGGNARRLALFLMASWIGFTLGQVLGDLLNMQVALVGVIHFFSATIGTYIALGMVWLLTRPSDDSPA